MAWKRSGVRIPIAPQQDPRSRWNSLHCPRVFFLAGHPASGSAAPRSVLGSEPWCAHRAPASCGAGGAGGRPALPGVAHALGSTAAQQADPQDAGAGSVRRVLLPPKIGVILLTWKALSLCSRKAPRCLRTTTEGKTVGRSITRRLASTLATAAVVTAGLTL